LLGVGLHEFRQHQVRRLGLPDAGELPLAGHELRGEAGLRVLWEGQDRCALAREQRRFGAREDEGFCLRAATYHA
jgi:hypothetical protein